MADLSFDSPNLSRIERSMELDQEIKRCENSLLEAQETNVRCQEAHENIERALLTQNANNTDIFTSTRGRWPSSRPSMKNKVSVFHLY